MMMLDTNVIIAAINKRPPSVATRFDTELAAGRALAVSSIVEFELRYGAAKSARKQANDVILDQFLATVSIIAFEADDARCAGELRVVLQAAGTPIGPYDLLIAAQALRHGATLVTANVREFARVPSLKVVDWAGA